ncbi:MAG: SGNH/GDSL hydrolase family protein [bacterium]
MLDSVPADPGAPSVASVSGANAAFAASGWLRRALDLLRARFGERTPLAVLVAFGHGFLLMLAAQVMGVCISCLPDWNARLALSAAATVCLFWGAGVPALLPMVAVWLVGWVTPALAIVVWWGLAMRLLRTRSRAYLASALGLLLFLWTSLIGDPVDASHASETLHPSGILCLGDSSAYGVFVDRSWCDMLDATKVAARGADADDTLAQWERTKALRPPWVVIQVGANHRHAADPAAGPVTDDDERLAALRRCFERVVADAAGWGGHVLVIDYPVARWPEPSWRKLIRDAVPAGARLVDPALPWWEITADHLHPTHRGHVRIAAAVRRVIDATPASG